MITLLHEKRPKNLNDREQTTWQALMRDVVTDVDELCNLLDLPETERKAAHAAQKLFPLKVPRSFIARMQKGNINDPLLRQILPLDAENNSHTDFHLDPVADLNNNPIPGIIHKYHGRALLIATGACAVHCRYCFRRHFPYSEQTAARQHWKQAIEYIEKDLSLNEVILSGGDPLSLSDDKLNELLSALNKIEHIKTIRIHSRQPVVLPERIDDNFIAILNQNSKNIIMVIHANHANEIDATVSQACNKLRDINVHVLNQAVLLKGVNNNLTDLENLSHALFSAGVLPYYLNLLDKVAGSAHFEVKKDEAIHIYEQLKTRLPGYLVPRLVQDISDRQSKTWIS